jgi:hypothetical protein
VQLDSVAVQIEQRVSIRCEPLRDHQPWGGDESPGDDGDTDVVDAVLVQVEAGKSVGVLNPANELFRRK